MLKIAAIALLSLCACLTRAQTVMSAHTLIEAEQQHDSSGTSIEPASTPIPMLMSMHDDWRLMLHTNIFIANTQQQANSARNRDAFFSTNWIMPMAQHPLGSGTITLRTMLSLEPATISNRNYPEIFQQGETAYGNPIIDGQHPHDFFMEVSALYDLPLSHNTLLSLYAAPIGDPAIGPTAYPHRQSASEDPIAALGHHQEDSTHIAFSVLTGGLTYRFARLELSGFHGAEPDEARWHFQPSPNGLAIDSVSTRLTLSPTPGLTGQYSIAHITSPESLYPHEDQQRQTASVMYHHTFRSSNNPGAPGPASETQVSAAPTMNSMQDMPGMDMSHDTTARVPHPCPRTWGMGGNAHCQPAHAMRMTPDPTTDLSTTFLWGRTRSLSDNSKANSYLAEALLRFASTNYIWTRLENAARTNELLLAPNTPLPPAFNELPIGHVAAYTLGYDHDIHLGPHILAAPGAQFTLYHSPQAFRSTYGNNPTAEVFFIRFRVR